MSHLPSSQILLSIPRLTPFWHAHLYPTLLGRQNVLHSPIPWLGAQCSFSGRHFALTFSSLYDQEIIFSFVLFSLQEQIIWSLQNASDNAQQIRRPSNRISVSRYHFVQNINNTKYEYKYKSSKLIIQAGKFKNPLPGCWAVELYTDMESRRPRWASPARLDTSLV